MEESGQSGSHSTPDSKSRGKFPTATPGPMIGRGNVNISERSYFKRKLWPGEEEAEADAEPRLTYIQTTVQIETPGGCGNEEEEEFDNIGKWTADTEDGDGSEARGESLSVSVSIHRGDGASDGDGDGDGDDGQEAAEVRSTDTPLPFPLQVEEKKKRRKRRKLERAASDSDGVKVKNDGEFVGGWSGVGTAPGNIRRDHHHHHHHPEKSPPPRSSSSLRHTKRRHVSQTHQLQRNAFSFESTLDNDNGRSEELKERLRSIVADFSRRASKTKQKIQKPLTPTSGSEDGLDEDASEPQLMNRMAEFFPNANSTDASSSESNTCPRGGEGGAGRGRFLECVGQKWRRVQRLLAHFLALNFVLDNQSLAYVGWLAVVSSCFAYNAWVISLRGVFPYQTERNERTWFLLDTLADSVYLVDTLLIKSNIKFIRNGFWVKDPQEIRSNYFTSFQFKVGLASLFPLDIVYALFLSNQPWLRLPRLLKIETFWELFRRFDSVLSSPHPVRIVRSVLSMLYLIHLYACAYYLVSTWERNAGVETDWIFDQVGNAYIRCFHFATKTVTSIGKNPKPENEIEYLFMTVAWLSGVFVFAVLIGQIRDIIATATKSQTEYRQLLYATMNYLHRIGVPRHLQERVQLWLTYTWQQQKTLDETEIVSLLPHKMQTDIALHVHIGMLNKVKLFQHCEVAFLRDLVLKLRSIIFLPGDFVCRKGEVGHEMYIVKTGRVDVIGGEAGSEKLLASLHAGSVFGEIALLQIGGMDKRTADVKSAGFSNLFVLSKKDIGEVVKDYPDAQESLRKQAKRLMKQKARSSKDVKVVDKEKRRGVRRNETASTELGATIAGDAVPTSTLVSIIVSDTESESESDSTRIFAQQQPKLPQPKLIDTVLQLVPFTSKTAQYLQYGSKKVAKVAASAASASVPSSVDVDSFSSYPPSPYLSSTHKHFSNFNVSLSNSSSENALSILSSGPQTANHHHTNQGIPKP